jgi:hypothetical protein
MSAREVFTISDTSPASASTAVGIAIRGLGKFPFIRLDAALVGATGGALDVYVQREIAPNVWADWIHFTQLAAGGAAVKWTAFAGPGVSTALTGSYGIGTTATPGVALAANTFTGGHPGDAIRMVYVAGASTSAGAAVLVYVTAHR